MVSFCSGSSARRQNCKISCGLALMMADFDPRASAEKRPSQSLPDNTGRPMSRRSFKRSLMAAFDPFPPLVSSDLMIIAASEDC